MTANINPEIVQVFLNQIYEFKKGVRRMVLFTAEKKYEDFTTRRLSSQNIDYLIQPVGNDKINLFFGNQEIPFSMIPFHCL